MSKVNNNDRLIGASFYVEFENKTGVDINVINHSGVVYTIKPVGKRLSGGLFNINVTYFTARGNGVMVARDNGLDDKDHLVVNDISTDHRDFVKLTYSLPLEDIENKYIYHHKESNVLITAKDFKKCPVHPNLEGVRKPEVSLDMYYVNHSEDTPLYAVIYGEVFNVVKNSFTYDTPGVYIRTSKDTCIPPIPLNCEDLEKYRIFKSRAAAEAAAQDKSFNELNYIKLQDKLAVTEEKLAKVEEALEDEIERAKVVDNIAVLMDKLFTEDSKRKVAIVLQAISDRKDRQAKEISANTAGSKAVNDGLQNLGDILGDLFKYKT